MATEPNDTAAEEETGSRKMDGELRVIGQMLRLLDDLDNRARARVVYYLSCRYQDGAANWLAAQKS